MAGRSLRSWNGCRWVGVMYGGRVYRYAYHGLYFLEGICICTLLKMLYIIIMLMLVLWMQSLLDQLKQLPLEKTYSRERRKGGGTE
jgi:uncharacterized membrane protein